MKNRSVLGVIFLTVFIDLLGFGIVLPLLPIWAESFTRDKGSIIRMAAAFSLAQFLFAPIWGRLSDRIGRRPILLCSLLGGAVAFLGMALADRLLMLYAARTLQGVFTAGGIAAAPALIADVTAPEERSKGMGMIGAAFGLGFIFGPVAGSLLSEIGPAFPFYVAAALSFGNFLLASRILPETRKMDEARSEHFFDPKKLFETLTRPILAFLVILFFVNTLAFANLETTFSLFVQDHFRLSHHDAKRYAGGILGYVGVIAVIIQGGLIGRLTKLFGERKLLVAGILLTGGGMSLLPLTSGVPQLLLALTVMSSGVGIANPSLASLVSRCAARDRQGGILGVTQGLGSLARAGGSFWGAWMYGEFGMAWPYWTGGAILGASFLMCVVFILPGAIAGQPIDA